MKKVRPFLWFDGNIEEAVEFYTSIFKNAKVHNVSPQSAQFELESQEFMAFNGGPHFAFSEAISFFVNCETQAEVDYYWERLTADGGEASRCGWLKDKFGLSWQIIPSLLSDMLSDDDDAKSAAAMQAMLGMQKIDCAALQRAYDAA